MSEDHARPSVFGTTIDLSKKVIRRHCGYPSMSYLNLQHITLLLHSSRGAFFLEEATAAATHSYKITHVMKSHPAFIP